MVALVAVEPVQYGGRRHEPGQPFEADAKSAAQLLALGAAREPAAQRPQAPPAAAVPVADKPAAARKAAAPARRGTHG